MCKETWKATCVKDKVRIDPDWESWNFGKLCDTKIRGCVYSEDTVHKATQCDKVTVSQSVRKYLRGRA